MTYTAFIPARSGSKRLKNKNIKMLAGKPLLVWSLNACIESDSIDEVILSTDSMDCWNIANEYIKSDKLKLDFRTEKEAGDTIKIFDYLKEKRDKIFTDKTGAFILTLPTVPLRTKDHINEAIEKFNKEKLPVFSATSYGFPISFAFYGKNNEWIPVYDESPMLTGNTRSQNQKEVFHPNGAIYIRLISDLNKPDLKTLYDDAIPYYMDRESSVDIDNEIDFKIAEALLAC